jgi:hypothetical protein
VDDTYSKYRFFIATFPTPRQYMEKLFGKHYGDAKNSVQRVFDFLSGSVSAVDHARCGISRS